jgi:hypothetical protein
VIVTADTGPTVLFPPESGTQIRWRLVLAFFSETGRLERIGLEKPDDGTMFRSGQFQFQLGVLRMFC